MARGGGGSGGCWMAAPDGGKGERAGVANEGVESK